MLKRVIAKKEPAPRPVFIYCLKDPRTGESFYVGKTVNMKSRLKGHVRDSLTKEAQASPGKKQRRIQEIKDAGHEPTIHLLEKTSERAWKRAERKWIASFRKKLGTQLLNEAPGGNYIPYKKRKAWLKKKNKS